MTSGGAPGRLSRDHDRGPLLLIYRQKDRGHVADFALGWLTRSGSNATAPSGSRPR